MTRGTKKKTFKGIFQRKPPTLPLPTEDEIDSLFADMRLESRPNIRFEDLKLSNDILKGIHAYGLERPSQIQQGAIPFIKKGRDVILQAQSGMGKTAAFCIGIIEAINTGSKKTNVQCLVLAPTRELAQQIGEVFTALAQCTKVKILVCTGGNSRTLEINKSNLGKENIHIVVGTLGRIEGLVGLGYIQLCDVNIFALDEADKWLTDMKQCRKLAKITKDISGDAQIILASATMPPDVVDATSSLMRSPKTFLINNEDLTLEGIKQFYINVNDDDEKVETIRDMYPFLSKSHVVIFCSTRAMVKRLKNRLHDLDVDLGIMSGDMRQNAREDILQGFRSGKNRVLITSDVIGRGVDVQQLYCVINYDLPMHKVDYIHRVGRGGRFGRKGLAITLAGPKEQAVLKEIAEYYHTEINELEADFRKLF